MSATSLPDRFWQAAVSVTSYALAFLMQPASAPQVEWGHPSQVRALQVGGRLVRNPLLCLNVFAKLLARQYDECSGA